MSVQIKRVESKTDLNKFIMFPHELYKECEHWVPPMVLDEKETLNQNKNPAFDHASCLYWLAYKNGDIVGRVAGIHLDAEVEEKKLARFGWIDFVDDEEVSRALIQTVENWAEELNLVGIHGPLGFSDMDPQGMLVEGFDSMNTMATIYNYEYYSTHLEKLGYSTSAEWIEYKGNMNFEFGEQDYKRTNFLKERFGFEVLDAKKAKDFVPHGKDMFRLINETYTGLYGFYPLSDHQIEYYIGKYLKFIRTDYTCMILKNEKLIGFGVAMPSFSNALKKIGGKLLPFGWVEMLKAFKANEIIDLYLVSVDPKFVQLGVTRLIFFEIFKNLKNNGSKFIYTNPILQGNTAAKQMWSSPLATDEDIHIRKRRQCFLKIFANE